MSDVEKNDTNSSSESRLAGQVSFLFLTGFFLVFLSSAYLQRGGLDNFLSFHGADTPGAIPNAQYPQPFGAHFFGDFLLPIWQSQLPDPWVTYVPAGPPLTNYFPFAMGVFWIFARFSYWWGFLLFFVLSTLLCCIPLARSLKRFLPLHRLHLMVGTVLLTSPTLSLIDRGNIQILLTGLCLSAIYFFSVEKYRWAAVLLGLAIGLKIYPIVFLILFLKKREWSAILASLVTACFVSILPLFFYQGGILGSLSSLWKNIQANESLYTENYIAYNNSIKSTLMTIDILNISFIGDFAEYLVNHFWIVLLLCGSLALLSFCSTSTSIYELGLVCASLMCGLADYVAPYVLGIFFVPILLFWFETPKISNKISIWYGWLIAILMAPKGFPVKFWNTNFANSLPTYSSLMSGAAMLAILITVAGSNLSGIDFSRFAARLNTKDL